VWTGLTPLRQGCSRHQCDMLKFDRPLQRGNTAVNTHCLPHHSAISYCHAVFHTTVHPDYHQELLTHNHTPNFRQPLGYTKNRSHQPLKIRSHTAGVYCIKPNNTAQTTTWRLGPLLTNRSLRSTSACNVSRSRTSPTLTPSARGICMCTRSA
jgi:hypothetical protein